MLNLKEEKCNALVQLFLEVSLADLQIALYQLYLYLDNSPTFVKGNSSPIISVSFLGLNLSGGQSILRYSLHGIGHIYNRPCRYDHLCM